MSAQGNKLEEPESPAETNPQVVIVANDLIRFKKFKKFLEDNEFPTQLYSTFQASEITKTEGGEYAYSAKGKLTLKGVTKDVVMNFNYIGLSPQSQKDEKGVEHKYNVCGFEGKTVIKRKDFGVGGDIGIGDDVTITITLEASQDVK